MVPQGSENSGQGHWFSRSTSHLVSCGWTEGITRGRSWSGAESLPPDWYLESLIEDVRDELQRLRDEGAYTDEEVRARTKRLTEIIDKAFRV